MLKHFALRLVLWQKGHTPLNLTRFLDGCARLILTHRMLLDHFARNAERSCEKLSRQISRVHLDDCARAFS